MATFRRVRNPQNSAKDVDRTQTRVLADIEQVYRKIIPQRSASSVTRSKTSHLRYRQQNQTGRFRNDSIREDTSGEDIRSCSLMPSFVNIATTTNNRRLSRESSTSSLITQLSNSNSVKLSLNGLAEHYPTSQTIRFLQERNAAERARNLRMSANPKTHRIERGYIVCGVKCPQKSREEQSSASIQRSKLASSQNEATSRPCSKPRTHLRRFTRNSDFCQQESPTHTDNNEEHRLVQTTIMSNRVNENKRITIHQYHTETENMSKINQWMEKNQRTDQISETPVIQPVVIDDLPSAPTRVKTEVKEIDADSGLKSISSTSVTPEDIGVPPGVDTQKEEITDNASENSIPTTPGYVKSVSFSVPVATVYDVPTIDITPASDTDDVDEKVVETKKLESQRVLNSKTESSESMQTRVYTTSL